MALPPSYFLGLLTPHTAPPKALDFSALGEVTSAMRQNRQFDRTMELEGEKLTEARRQNAMDTEAAQIRAALERQKFEWNRRKAQADVKLALKPELESGEKYRTASAEATLRDYGIDPGAGASGPAGGLRYPQTKPGIGSELPTKPNTAGAASGASALSEEEYTRAVDTLIEDEESRRAGRGGSLTPGERGRLRSAIERTDDEEAAVRSPAEIRQEETGEDFETYRGKAGKVASGGVGLRDQGVSFEPGEPLPPQQPAPVASANVPGLPGASIEQPLTRWDERKERMRDMLMARAAGAGPGFEQARANIENTFESEYDALVAMPGMTQIELRKALLERFDTDRTRFAKLPGDNTRPVAFDPNIRKKGSDYARDQLLKGTTKQSNLKQSFENLRLMREYSNEIAGWRETGDVNGMVYNSMIFRISKIVAPGDRITDTDFARMTGIETWSAALENWFRTGTGFSSKEELLAELMKNGAFSGDGNIALSEEKINMMDQFVLKEVARGKANFDSNVTRVRKGYAFSTAGGDAAFNYGMAEAVNAEFWSMDLEPVYAPTPSDIVPLPAAGMSLEDAKKQAKIRLRNYTQTDDPVASKAFLDAHRHLMSTTRQQLIEDAIADVAKTSQMSALQDRGEDLEVSKSVTSEYFKNKRRAQ